jgi:hypothetical protein
VVVTQHGCGMPCLSYRRHWTKRINERCERSMAAVWELAHRLFQCVAVASRPLRVDELAEFLAFEFEEDQVPGFHEGWRSEDPLHAVLSTCSSLLSVVYQGRSPVVEFSHFSVKEFLMSARLAEQVT